MNLPENNPSSKQTRLNTGALALAITATGISACLSVIASWERGGQTSERLVWVGVSLVLLLGAHLLPALSRNAAPLLRAPVLGLWIAAMLATSYGHATFFLLAQQHAGERRADALDATAAKQSTNRGDLVAPHRDRSTIAAERARVTANIAALDAQTCASQCNARTARRASLSGRLDALNVEFEEATRREQSADRFEAEQDKLSALRAQAMDDPVTAPLARLIGTTAAHINLAVGLAFGAALEGVACVAWLLALSSPAIGRESVARSHVSATQSHVAPSLAAPHASQSIGSPESDRESVVSHAATAPEVATIKPGDSVTDGDAATVRVLVAKTVSAEVARLAAAIEAGTCRRTVSDIRAHMRCSQQRAIELRRELGEAMPELTGRVRMVA